MTPLALARLYAALEDREGRSRVPYLDTAGNLTLAIGHKTVLNGSIPLSDKAIDAILEGDVEEMIRRCTHRLDRWDQLNEPRQAACIEMAFNGALFASPKALAALSAGDYDLAAREFLDGPWPIQVGLSRARLLTEQIRTGEYPQENV